jgi:hypothetical protein
MPALRRTTSGQKHGGTTFGSALIMRRADARGRARIQPVQMEPRRGTPSRPDTSPWRHRAPWTLAVVVLLLIAGRLALTAFATWRTRQALATLPGFRSDFSDVSVSMLHLSYTIDGLELRRDPTSDASASGPVRFRAKRIRVGLDWRQVVRNRAIVVTVKLQEPMLDVVVAGSRQAGTDLRVGEQMSRVPSMAIERFDVQRAAVAFIEATGDGRPAFWLHDLDAAIENLATRPALAHGEPAMLAASGSVQKTGQLSVFVTADPFSRRITLCARASIEHLDVHEVASLVAKETDYAPRKGTIDLFAEIHVLDGRISGGVKPVLKDVDVAPSRPGLAPKLKAWLVDTGQRPVGRAGGRRAAAGVPLRGDISNPRADTWPATWTLLRNAFANGLAATLEELPRAMSEKGTAPKARTPSGRGLRDTERVQPDQGCAPEMPGRPPLAASPGGVLVPGAVERIQQALAARGYLDLRAAKRGQIDDATASAIRKLQSDQDIARTGFPDHETVRRLGLDPDRLFRRGGDARSPSVREQERPEER